MNCTQARKNFPLFVGGDLDPETAGLIRNHLKSCPGCRRELKDYERSYSVLVTLRERPDVFPFLEGLSGDVLVRLAEEPAGKAAPIPRLSFLIPFRPFRSFSRTAAAAAAVIILAGAAFFAGFNWQGRPSAPGESAAALSSSGAPGGNVLPAGMDAAGREGLKPEFIIFRPQQLPRVRPALHRRGF